MKECDRSRHKEVRRIETLGGGFEEQIEHQVHAGFQRIDREPIETSSFRRIRRLIPLFRSMIAIQPGVECSGDVACAMPGA
jgi:hypothetical protein